MAAAALTVAAPAAAERPDRGPGPLPWRIGHEAGFTADAVSFPDSVGTTLEVYLRIRPRLIADLCRDGREPTPIRVVGRLRSIFGGRSVEREMTFRVEPADTLNSLGEVVVLSFPAKPGPHRLELRLETRRREMARKGVSGPEVAKVAGQFEIPGPQAGREISGLEFVWAEASGPSARVFGRSGRGLIPNPERLYGLYENQVRAFFTARGAAADARPWRWVARVYGGAGEVLAESGGSGDPGSRLSAEVSMDVSALPAGGYDLEVKAWQEGDAGALLRRSRFCVAWQLDSWRRDPREIADDAHFLLQAEDEERFEQLQAGEQEAVLDSFWVRRDPTPDTGENEARSIYAKRVDYANRMYGRYGLGRGMFTDMGRTYIRYGEPGEVYRQVIPALGDNLSNLISQLARSESRSLGAVGSREIGADMRPFELWIYEGDIPLPVDADPSLDSGHATRRRLVFLFVDKNWLGDYRLLYSSE